MVNHDRPDSSEEIVLRFGLLIDKIIKNNTTRFEIKSNNSGIPDAEFILIIEAYLEKIKKNFKQPIKVVFHSFLRQVKMMTNSYSLS